MIVEMKKFEERFGISFVNILSQCLRTRSMSGAVLEDLRRGLLRSYLKCLVKVIEQQLCSSTTSSMKFSWRLPRNLYLLEERKTKLLSSTEEELEKRVILLPMKILDDLNICEQRAILRAEPHLSGKPTTQQELGKRWWSKKREKYSRLICSVMKNIGLVHDVWSEHSVMLTYVGNNVAINLMGLSDMVVFMSLKCSNDYIPLMLLFEFTIYREVSNIIDRVIAYSSTLYNKYGFLTIPIITVIKELYEDLVERIILLMNINKTGTVYHLLLRLKKLEKLLSGELEPKHASQEICYQCDAELRRRCIFYH